MKKKYLYKIYNNAGLYLTTWKEVSAPSFSYKINSGLSDLTVKLARNFFDFGESFDVKLGNELRLYVTDVETSSKVQIYSGELSKYNLSLDTQDSVEVTFTGYITELAKRVVVNGSATTISYSTEEPADVIKDILDKVNGTVTYTSTSIDGTGLSVSYDLIQNTALEGIQRMVELAPVNWYWYVDSENVLQFHAFNTDNVLKLFIGKHINKLELTKSSENIINRYYFLGGGSPQLYNRYDRTSSQTEYGTKDKREQDERVTVTATATNRAANLLNTQDHPRMEVSCTVIDSNIDPKNGVDIEQLRPGQAVQIIHPYIETKSSKWDVSVWDIDVWDNSIESSMGQVLRIEEIQYFGNGAILKLGTLLPSPGQEIVKNTIQLETFRGKDAPTTPTII